MESWSLTRASSGTTAFVQTATCAASQSSVRAHSDKSVTCSLPHTWAHRSPCLIRVSQSDRGERVCHPSHPDSMLLLNLSLLTRLFRIEEFVHLFHHIYNNLRIGEPARSGKWKWSINNTYAVLILLKKYINSRYYLFEYPVSDYNLRIGEPARSGKLKWSKYIHHHSYVVLICNKHIKFWLIVWLLPVLIFHYRL